MAKYRMAMTAFGLDRGDTFESNDPGWADRAKAGFVSVVPDTEETTVGGKPDPVEPFVTDDPALRGSPGALWKGDPVELSDEEYETRVAAGDPVLVKPGEVRREQVPGVVVTDG